ncbi:MAG: hypothetical protein GY869_14470, partial [Planctomycetes bacterium]|nr:hypothetical protein [Planctomycetota bacterium]
MKRLKITAPILALLVILTWSAFAVDSPHLTRSSDLQTTTDIGATSTNTITVDNAVITSGDVSTGTDTNLDLNPNGTGAIVHSADVLTDRWINNDDNTFFGSGVAGAGNL